jgi:hypothetical protein
LTRLHTTKPCPRKSNRARHEILAQFSALMRSGRSSLSTRGSELGVYPAAAAEIRHPLPVRAISQSRPVLSRLRRNDESQCNSIINIWLCFFSESTSPVRSRQWAFPVAVSPVILPLALQSTSQAARKTATRSIRGLGRNTRTGQDVLFRNNLKAQDARQFHFQTMRSGTFPKPVRMFLTTSMSAPLNEEGKRLRA